MLAWCSVVGAERKREGKRERERERASMGHGQTDVTTEREGADVRAAG